MRPFAGACKGLGTVKTTAERFDCRTDRSDLPNNEWFPDRSGGNVSNDSTKLLRRYKSLNAQPKAPALTPLPAPSAGRSTTMLFPMRS